MPMKFIARMNLTKILMLDKSMPITQAICAFFAFQIIRIKLVLSTRRCINVCIKFGCLCDVLFKRFHICDL